MKDFYSRFTPYSFDNFGMVRLPYVQITDEQKIKVGLTPTASNYNFLTALARVGFKNKNIPKNKWAIYGERIKRELNIFEELGFTDYVLLVWLVIEKARSLGSFIDFGRGSCAGSAVFWLLGITGVDPIDKNLLLERFVSRVRSKKQLINGQIYLQGDLIADADLNLGSSREEIVEWLKTVYPNRIAKISTRSTLTGKSLIKDVYKAVEEVSEEEAKRVSNMIDRHFGIVEDIEEVYKHNKEFQEWANEHKKTYDIALKLRDLIRQKSSHASGYLISYTDFNGFVPLELNSDDEPMASFDMKDVSNFAVKLDLLGLTTNAIIKKVADNIDEDIAKIDLDNNPLIYDQFQHGKLLPYGLYQISADCAYRVLNQVKPKNVFELSDVNALARPGALSFVDGYVKGNTSCPHPIFEPILKSTRNYCLYQEQMMQMAVALGFTLDESELLRKVVGKKQVDKVKEWKDKIYAKVKEKGFDPSLADLFWQILEDSSKYSFNASHSVATSYLSALTVYLKYKYPIQFYWSCLEACRDLANPMEEVALIISEMRQMNIKIFPPDIIKSSNDFTIEPDGIRFGLSHIRGVSDTTMKKLTSFRRAFTSKFEIFEAAQEAKINISVLSGLIYAGVVSIPNVSRSKLVIEAQIYNLLTPRELPIIKMFAPDYNDDLVEILKALRDEKDGEGKVIRAAKVDEKGKLYIKESRMETLRRDMKPAWVQYQQNARHEELTAYLMERHYLGFSYSNTLHNLYSRKVPDLTPISLVISEPKDIQISFVAFVDEVKKGTGKTSGKSYVRFELSDESGKIKAMLSGDNKIEGCEQFNGRLPIAGDVVVVHGSKSDSNDMVFAQSVIIQQIPIKLRKSGEIEAPTQL